MSKELVLAVDLGTRSVRTLVFDGKGKMHDFAQIVYAAPYNAPRPGWAEQDPEAYWQCLADCCQKLWAQGKVSPDSLAAMTLTCQRATMINLDQQGNPLRPAIVWLDQRRAGKLPPVGPLMRAVFRLAGLSGTIRYLQSEAEVNWIIENQPEIWEKTAHYLFLSGYLTHRLTARYVDSVGCQVGYVPFNYKTQTWEKPFSWKWKAIPVRPEMLPELVPPGRPLGTVTAGAAQATGLPEGLKIIAGASDKACEVLGSGCVAPHQACIGFGTTATINVNSSRYLEPVPLIPPYPSAIAGAYNIEVQIYRGFWMVTWFQEQFAQLEKARAEQEGVSAEELLERTVADIPPGSLGLTLQPYWSPGLKYPGPEARGAVIGFGGVHTKAHFYRALLEGLAYGMRDGRDRIQRRTGVPVKELFVCGGGSRSDQVMQITADVFGLPAARPAYDEASGLGAAILAAAGAGLHSDLKTAIREMTGAGRVFEPRPEAVKIYNELYQKVYLKMYAQLRPFYKDMQAITGYPPVP